MGSELSRKTAIVTGGASGIGRATVELFAEEGAQVVIADVDPSGEELAKRLGRAARFKRTDVSQANEVQDLIDFAVAEFGGLHIMFNNAGISDKGHCRILDDDFQNFHQVMAVNVLGVMLGSQRAGRYMAKHGGGSIINNASIAALMPTFGLQTYRASKSAVVQFTKAIAIDLAEYGIRVNCLAPGHIRPTAMTAAASAGMEPEMAARLEKAILGVTMSYQPLKRQGSPRDVAEAVLFLASDRAAQITGILLPVDGGVTAGDSVNHLDQMARARAEALGGG